MGCPTGKVRFRDEIGAKIALANTARRRASRREESRAYYCKKCRGWHLTKRA